MKLKFGKRLRELRLEKKMTQEQLGNAFGVSYATICRWERGDQQPNLDMVIKIMVFFQVSAGYLLGTED